MKRKAGHLIIITIIPFIFLACAKEDVIVQSLFDLSGAPLKYDDSKATRFLNVAAVSMEVSYEKDKNLQKMTAIIRNIKKEEPQTELILFGETILGWYIDDDNPVEYQQSVAEEIPGHATGLIGHLADSLNVYIVFGLTEINEGNVYNSQVIINHEGAIEALHRKINLTPEDLKNGFVPGEKSDNNVTTAIINNIKAGIIICADISSFYLTKQLTAKKTELILHSMASEVAEFKIDPVSRQFNAWEVFANRYGKEGKRHYSGTTYVADPSGTIRVTGSGKEIVKFCKLAVR